MRRHTIGSDGPARLQALPQFAGLPAGDCRILARMVDELQAEPGEELMHEDDFGREVVVVETGAADVLQAGARINTVGPGDLVGELAVLGSPGTRTASVVATTPLRGLVFTSHFFQEVRRAMPEVAQAFDAAAADHRERDRLRQTGEQPE